MTAKRWSTVGMVVLYLLLTAAVVLIGLTLASAMRTERAVVENEAFTSVGATIYIHGQAIDDDTDLPIAGATARLFYNAREVGSSTSNASGYWGVSTAVQTGLYELRFTAPASHPRVVQVLKAPNITDFGLASTLLSCTFRVSPVGGQTGNFVVVCQALATATHTVTPHAPTPTFTATPEPVMPSPTWTPGPTPTTCYREPSAEMLTQARAIMGTYVAAGDDALTQMGFRLGLGWPMLRRSIVMDGQTVEGQLWTPFTIVARWPDGCYSIIDGGNIAP